jgi:acetyl esterase
MIDPALQAILEGMAASGFALPEPLAADTMRAALDNPFPDEVVTIADVRDVTLDGPDGALPARLYHPAPGEVLPLVVFLHGGGWVIGSIETHDRMCRRLARDSGCALLSLGYRLAPEHPYPAAVQDGLAAVAALPEKATEWGVRSQRYAVAGDSAGGNLAAAIALALAGKPDAPAHQLLLYPVLDRDFETLSYRTATDGGVLSPAMMRFFWEQYVGGTEPDALAAPLRASSLAGAAPATLILAGLDPLHDEGAAYAAALRQAGVPTSLFDFAGAIHGFASFAGLAPIADLAMTIAAYSLKSALA